ncbi:hypothetical protein [Gemmatimonas phototrophica]|uniref:hypothetical protein n=1 Tax=Gemmatimonas phototrophica TaxID=1379270 RepID=UPI0011AE8E2F|nr:hypothetical protein [Gemmatimonas phototrophica]
MTASFRDPLRLALGTTFQPGRELGRGGMRRVFMARDNTHGRKVVVKVLSPELAQELSVERFGRGVARQSVAPYLAAPPLRWVVWC